MNNERNDHPFPLVTSSLPPQDRILSLDVLRGFALLGIFLVNIGWFSRPIETELMIRSSLWQSNFDQIIDFLTMFLVEGKFYPIFSFLFGLGIALQIRRAENSKDTRFHGLKWRLLTLFLIGFLHYCLLWDGDVLATYAISGALLLLFRRRAVKTMIIWAVSIHLLVFISILGIGILATIAGFIPEFAEEISYEAVFLDSEYQAILVGVYQLGAYRDVLSYRTEELWFVLGYTFFAVPMCLGIQLFGFCIGRYFNLRDFIANRKKLTHWLFVFGVPGLFISLTGAMLSFVSYSSEKIGLLFTGYAFTYLGGFLLSATYILAVFLLLLVLPKMNLFVWLASAGRMALTNYLCQSLIATTLFYGYGFGLAETLSQWQLSALAIGIFTFQVFISHYWLLRFQLGPVEWVWRICRSR